MKNLKPIPYIIIICIAMIISVSSAPEVHKASDGSEYLIEKETKYSWHQAWNECARRDSKLVAIESEEKNKVIILLLKKVLGKPHNLWLGGNDEHSTLEDLNRPFYWLATGKKFNFTYWTDKNPNNVRGRENCVHIWNVNPEFRWNDAGCGSKMGFICELNKNVASCNKDPKNVCNAVKNFTSSVNIELDNIQQQQTSAINNNTADIDRIGCDWKTDLQQVQNVTQVAIQKIMNEQQNKINQLKDKVLTQIKNLGNEMGTCIAGINKQFGDKLNSKQNEINKIC